jgi:teichuronic acid biosynthesis glycosyltransferase TuaC
MQIESTTAPVVVRRVRGKLHVVTLTPFYPSDENEVRGCFVSETLPELEFQDVRSSVIAVDSIYHPARKPSHSFPAEWIRYPQFPGNLGLASAGTFLAATILTKIRVLHRKSPIDLIHAHAALPCGDAARVISQRLGIPFVVTIHGLDVFNRCFENGRAAKWREKTSLKVYENARHVICISDSVRQLLITGMNSSIAASVVYNGTDCELFAPDFHQDREPTILIVGNLLAGKGHELVFRAIEQLKEIYPTLQCRMIGEGADRDRFVKLAADLRIIDRVHFLGRLSRDQVAEAMRACTVFALPSRYEALGCAYLEAMACAKPVIACRGQGIEEIIHHGSNGWLIPVDGLDELVNGLRILLGDAELRRRVGEAARQTVVDKFTLSRQAEQLREVYEEATR